MSKTSKIVIGVIVCAAVVVVAGVAIWKSGYFEDSNYNRLKAEDYITLGEYENLTYTAETVEVTDEEVQEEIENRVDAEATTQEVTEGTVAAGDTITISYEGTIDGEAFSGGSANDSQITVGEAGFIDGFEDGLIGQEIGSSVTLNLTFPEDYYYTDVAGKDVVFVVQIESRTEAYAPEYNEDFVKTYTEYDTIAEFEEAVKQELLDEKQEEVDSTVKQELWTQVVEASEVTSYPEKQLAYELENIRGQYESTASNYGMTLSEYLEAMDYTEEDFEAGLQEYAESVCKQKLVLLAVSKKEGLSVSNKEYKQNLLDMLESAGFTEDTFESTYNMTIEEYGDQYELKTSMLLDKVCDLLLEKAQAVDETEDSTED